MGVLRGRCGGLAVPGVIRYLLVGGNSKVEYCTPINE